MRIYSFGLAVLAAAVLTACGGGGSDGPTVDNSLARGSLAANPPNLVPVPQPDGSFQATLAPTLFAKELEAGQPGITQVTGVPKCTITTYYMKYGTVGGAGEATDATGAIMVPSGTDPACTGPRPVLLYAHGTSYDKNYNMAQLDKNKEASLLAAMYAAQGFIVVAPNYAGYDVSKLSYTPYLNAEQSANDMIDSLRAARKAFAGINAQDSGKLFITGYSQGGHVAMATQRAMQTTYASEFKVTALAGQSGPYAMALLGDMVFGGTPNLGSTIFFPMISTSWQKSYGGLYSSTSDMYESQYATGIESLLPSLTPDTIFTSGKLPQLALFAADSMPQAAKIPGSFGSGNLIKTSFRNTYLMDMVAHPCDDLSTFPTSLALTEATPLNCAPANPFRQAGVKNDLRNYVPNVPVLLCGGDADPTVFWASTQMTAAYFTAKGMPSAALQILDVDSTPTGATDPFAAAKLGFSQAKTAAAQAAIAAGVDPTTAVTVAYHGSLVPPFCGAAARGFFQSVLAH